MNEQTCMDLMAFDSQIAPMISNDDRIASLAPFSGRIEFLVYPSVESEGRFTNSASERKITKAFHERIDMPNFSVGSIAHLRLHLKAGLGTNGKR